MIFSNVSVNYIPMFLRRLEFFLLLTPPLGPYMKPNMALSAPSKHVCGIFFPSSSKFSKDFSWSSRSPFLQGLLRRWNQLTKSAILFSFFQFIKLYGKWASEHICLLLKRWEEAEAILSIFSWAQAKKSSAEVMNLKRSSAGARFVDRNISQDSQRKTSFFLFWSILLGWDFDSCTFF